MRPMLIGVIGLTIGFILGRWWGVFDIYRQAGAGDYVNIPPELFRDMWKVGSVTVRYPAGWSVTATRRDPPRVTLHGEWGGGYLQINCSKNYQSHGLIVSKYNPSGDKIELRAGERKLNIVVSSGGRNNLNLDAVAVSQFVTFMAESAFPDSVIVAGHASQGADIKSSYSIPTIGVQNVSGTMVGSDGVTKPVPQPPSDPFKVMKRYCL